MPFPIQCREKLCYNAHHVHPPPSSCCKLILWKYFRICIVIDCGIMSIKELKIERASNELRESKACSKKWQGLLMLIHISLFSTLLPTISPSISRIQVVKKILLQPQKNSSQFVTLFPGTHCCYVFHSSLPPLSPRVSRLLRKFSFNHNFFSQFVTLSILTVCQQIKFQAGVPANRLVCTFATTRLIFECFRFYSIWS